MGLRLHKIRLREGSNWKKKNLRRLHFETFFGASKVPFKKIFAKFLESLEFRNHVESISRTQISLFRSWKCLFFISLIWFQTWKCRWNPPPIIGISKFWCRWNPPPNIRISGAKQFFVHFYVCFCIYIYVSISIGWHFECFITMNNFALINKTNFEKFKK